jgi:hypothetical protein
MFSLFCDGVHRKFSRACYTLNQREQTYVSSSQVSVKAVAGGRVLMSVCGWVGCYVAVAACVQGEGAGYKVKWRAL